MQKDKFEQAEGILDGNHTNEVPAISHAYVLSPQNIRKNSALYWKSKFMSAQALIEESHERSVQLDQIPGLLTISKITPKKTEQNVDVLLNLTFLLIIGESLIDINYLNETNRRPLYNFFVDDHNYRQLVSAFITDNYRLLSLQTTRL